MRFAELKRLYKMSQPDGHYFDHYIMRHFGDTARNYGVRKNTSYLGYPILELHRKQPVAQGRIYSVYFEMDGRYIGYKRD